MESFRSILCNLISYKVIFFLKHPPWILLSLSKTWNIKIICWERMLQLRWRFILLSVCIWVLILSLMLFFMCTTGRIIACSWAIAISSEEVHVGISRVRLISILYVCWIVFTSGKLKIWFWLSWVFFWPFEWEILHFFIEFAHLLSDWLNLFLSLFLLWFQSVLFLDLYWIIFLAHKGLQSRCSTPLISKRGKSIKLLVASFCKDDWRWHFWSLKRLVSKIEVSGLGIFESWLSYFDHCIRLLFNEPSHALEFAESRFGGLLTVSWRLDHGRKDCPVVLVLGGHEERSWLVGGKMGLLRVHIIEVYLLGLWLLMLFLGILGIHKY